MPEDRQNLRVTVPASTPTVGAVVGSILGAAIAARTGVTDAVTGGAIISASAACVTWLFHLIHAKVGVPE